MSNFASTRRESRQAFISVYPFELSNGGEGITMDLLAATLQRVALVGDGDQAMIANTGDYPAHLKFGSSSVNASNACVTIFPGVPYTLTITDGATHVSGYAPDGATTIQINLGYGN